MPWPGWDSAEITTQLCVSNYTHVTTRKSFLCFKFYVKYHRRGMQVEYHLWCLRSQTGWVWSLVLPVPFNLPVLHFSICQVELLPPPGNACMDFAESRVPVTQRKAWRMSALWLESLPWNLLFFCHHFPLQAIAVNHSASSLSHLQSVGKHHEVHLLFFSQMSQGLLTSTATTLGWHHLPIPFWMCLLWSSRAMPQCSQWFLSTVHLITLPLALTFSQPNLSAPRIKPLVYKAMTFLPASLASLFLLLYRLLKLQQ